MVVYTGNKPARVCDWQSLGLVNCVDKLREANQHGGWGKLRRHHMPNMLSHAYLIASRLGKSGYTKLMQEKSQPEYLHTGYGVKYPAFLSTNT